MVRTYVRTYTGQWFCLLCHNFSDLKKNIWFSEREGANAGQHTPTLSLPLSHSPLLNERNAGTIVWANSGQHKDKEDGGGAKQGVTPLSTHRAASAARSSDLGDLRHYPRILARACVTYANPASGESSVRNPRGRCACNPSACFDNNSLTSKARQGR